MSQFMSSTAPKLDSIIIIGGGLAGLYCALQLAPLNVTILSPQALGEGASSSWAQGGIAAAMDLQDTAEAHAQDTILAGAGLVDEDEAISVAQEASSHVLKLLSLGVPFDRDLDGHLIMSQEAAHSMRRVVRVNGDQAGKSIMEALVSAVRTTPSIRILEGYLADHIIKNHNDEIEKLRFINLQTGDVLEVNVDALILATGGIGALFAVTTNPSEANGSGLGLALHAGAQVSDIEFVQFHPTALKSSTLSSATPAPLLTEALRGEGATLINEHGERFCFHHHANGELAPRDIVARAVYEADQNGGAWLDCQTSIGVEFPYRFPKVFAACTAAGFDPRLQPIPVAPAAHYHMGGVWVDEHGRTSVDKLWACGEVACTGLHGANRLASNSLLEAVVYGARVAVDIQMRFAQNKSNLCQSHHTELNGAHLSYRVENPIDYSDLRKIMTNYVGVLRNHDGLVQAVQSLEAVYSGSGSQHFKNSAIAALMIARAALAREESRGAHARTDFPFSDPAQQRHSFYGLS